MKNNYCLPNFSIEINCKFLPIKKQAARHTAFIRTSKSMGKLIPKISASVKASFSKPDLNTTGQLEIDCNL